MTLTTENDVRWFQAAHAFERDVVERLDEYFEPRDQSAENSANFTRARSLAVDGVVDELN